MNTLLTNETILVSSFIVILICILHEIYQCTSSKNNNDNIPSSTTKTTKAITTNKNKIILSNNSLKKSDTIGNNLINTKVKSTFIFPENNEMKITKEDLRILGSKFSYPIEQETLYRFLVARKGDLQLAEDMLTKCELVK